MKKQILKSVYCITFLTFLLSTYSCSVIGLTVGTIIDKSDDTNYNTPLLQGESWIEPEYSKCNVSLTLENGVDVYGRYKGMSEHHHDNIITDIILVEVKGHVKKIPSNKVDYTTIYKVKKNRAKTGFIVGISLDFVTIVAIMASGGLDPIGNINLKFN